jgi:recombination DNA repair RAD52 pathway protein
MQAAVSVVSWFDQNRHSFSLGASDLVRVGLSRCTKGQCEGGMVSCARCHVRACAVQRGKVCVCTGT